jgi:hypothetical protein
MRLRLVPLTALTLLTLATSHLGGCQDPTDHRPRVVNFTPPDAAEPRDTFRHRESGLVFTTPGSGWRQLAPLEAGRLDPTALLAFQSRTPDCRGWATLHTLADAPPLRDPHDTTPRPPDAPPAAPDLARKAADLARIATLETLEAPAVHVDEYVLYDLWTARRWELQGKRDGTVTSIRATFFVDEDRLYRIQAEASGPLYGERRRCLDQITAGFVFAKPPLSTPIEAPSPGVASPNGPAPSKP